MNKKLYAISNAHLDTQWNWTIQDTIRDCIKDTLTKNFDLIEKYPHYCMNFEGAFRYKLAKEYYPDLYEKLKKYIADGRWNVAGSAWDANDANVPSSEAYMRQILYGNGYFEREFGKKSSDIFLTDCFGFRYSLPSIAAHMGLNGFSTQKLVWGVGAPIYNDDGTVSKPMPDTEHERMDLGRWQGPDGKSIIATMLGGNYTYQFDNNGDERPANMREEFLKQIELNEKHTGLPIKGTYFGVGDYGGAARESCVKMIEDACEDKNGLYEVVFSSTDQIFNELTPEQIEKLPIYDGALQIPHGSGALTSRAVGKRWNRKNELLADSAEKASVLAEYASGKPYPAERIRTAWETFLWHQFHDDLPGTSIIDAYTFSYNDYIIALNMFAAELGASVDSIISVLNTNVEGTPIAVFNPVSTSRTDLVTADVNIAGKNVRVFDNNGNEVPSQLAVVNGKTVVKFVVDVAPVSCTIFDVRESELPCQLKSALNVTTDSLENQRYIIKIDKNGDICSIIDKLNSNRELLSSPIRLEIGEDNNTNWPSWELRPQDLKLPPKYVEEIKSKEISDLGPAVVSITITRVFDRSEFVQKISLYSGSNRVDVDNHVEWYQRKSMLRAAYSLAVSNEKATFDLGLGAEVLPNSEYPYFQNTVHQWADLTNSDGSYGVSILNDCKYGMDKPSDNTLRLTLIHTPLGAYSDKSMQDWQDMGTNIFKYSLAGHAGTLDSIPAEAAALNQPVIPFTSDKHNGNSNSISYVECSSETVIIRAVKKEEKGNRIIVRIQETAGKDLENVKLKFIGNIKSAKETNGYEDEIGDVKFESNTLTFDITHFSPKTFAIELDGAATGKTDEGYAIELPYTKRVTSPNTNKAAGDFANGIAIPSELYNETVNAGNVNFKLAPADRPNAVVSDGQVIKLPAGAKKLYILAASTNGDKKAEFLLDGKATEITVQDFKENVGAWDVVIKNISKKIKRNDIAVNYTHTHDKNGDRLYLFAYLFKYCFNVENVSEITLPVDSDIIVMAATAEFNESSSAPAALLYDSTDTESKPMHKLTIIAGDDTKTELFPEGKRIFISKRGGSFDPKKGIFKGFDGNIVWSEDNVVAVDMGEEDISITAVYDSLGTPAAFDLSSCKANHFMNNAEAPINAVTANDEKWCGAVTNDECWLEIKLERPTELRKWLVVHAGVAESKSWNTCDFALEYKLGDSEWKIADSVTGNTENITNRIFDKITADTVRLNISKPTNTGDPHSRIYLFNVFEA